MAEAEKETPESLSSVELSRNAKGGTQIKVKIYNEDPDIANTKAADLYDALCKKYSS